MNDYTDLPAIFGQSPYASYDSQEVKAYINLNFDGITAGNCSIALLPLCVVSLPPSADIMSDHTRINSLSCCSALQGTCVHECGRQGCW